VADAWVRKAREKSIELSMQREKETLMGARKSFMDSGGLTSRTQMQLVPRKINYEVAIATKNSDPTVLKSFLQKSMKLLTNQKAIEGLQELIDNLSGKENP